MKIVITICASEMGGVANSTTILSHGLTDAGYSVDILPTSRTKGPFFEKMRERGVSIDAVADGEVWLRRRLEMTKKRLLEYGVVLNNHSKEARLVMPELPDHIAKLSVVRGCSGRNISEAVWESQYLDGLIAISPIVGKMLEEAGAKCPVTVIPNAVTYGNLALQPLHSPPRIVYFGRLSQRDKNILLLPDFVDALVKRGLDFEFSIIGDGPERGQLESRFSELGLINSVCFMGAVDHEDAESLLAESDFMIMPSFHEGFGLTLAEAMAVGTVPIASPIPVFSWILGEFADHLQVEENCGPAYVDKLLPLLGNQQQYSNIQQQLVERQRRTFTPEQTVRGYMELIRNKHFTSSNKRGTMLSRTARNSYPWMDRVRCFHAYYLLQILWKNIRRL